MLKRTLILGSGISGLSAGFHMKQKCTSDLSVVPIVIFEKDSDWGGLCSNFTIDGFRFDRFVHFTFAKEEYVHNIFSSSSPLYEHPAISNNYYKGYWLKHPAQNNLYPLPAEEKIKIIEDFKNRPQKEIFEIEDYATWLECQYGKYFAHNFPFAYTRKYWGKEAKELETKWVGERMHSPSLEEVLKGASEPHNDKNFYYTSVMRYPKKGGFRSILNTVREGLDIRFNKEAVKIDIQNKTILFKDGTSETYSNLISSLPLPEIIKMINNAPAPKEVVEASESLKYTSGYMVSLGFKRPDVAKDLWFYIYDEDILASRVYSPSLKSSDNVPEGCSSLQAEIFFANDVIIPSKEVVLENTIEKLSQIYSFDKNEIAVKDIRFEKYANIIFDHGIYKNRQVVLDYLSTIGIKSIGRFGKWEYFWTNQAFLDGKKSVEEFVGKCLINSAS